MLEMTSHLYPISKNILVWHPAPDVKMMQHNKTFTCNEYVCDCY